MKTIRPATAHDLEYLAKSSFDEFKLSVPFATSLTKLECNLAMFCFNDDARLMVVCDGDELCGYMTSSITKLMQWNDDLIAVETLFYVFPKYRNTRVAVMLITDFINW